MELAGRNALVTGAAGGLGGYIARALAAEGVNLALSDLPDSDMDDRLHAFRAMGVRAEAVPADLTVPVQASALVTAAEAAIGPLDILVNNAGLDLLGPFQDVEPAELEALVNVNLLAVMLLTHAVLPGMIERGRGHVVTVSSIGGKMALPYLAPYSATKFGVAAFMRALSAEFGSGPVSFSSIFPGAIREVGMAVRAGRLPLERLTSRSPEQVGAAVVRAIRQNRLEVVVSAQPARVPEALTVAAPGLSIRLMRIFAKRALEIPLRRQGRL